MAIDKDELLAKQQNEVDSKLWAMANELRGNMDASEFKNYILGLIFYKFLSDKITKNLNEELEEGDLTFEDAWKDADIDSQINVTLSVADTSAQAAASESYYWESLRKDRYAAFTADQLDILQGLPVGEYELTLELNRPRNIRETDYDNNFSNLVFAVVPSTTVTFMSDGNEYTVKRFETGAKFVRFPEDPKKRGYKFMGWFTEEEEGTLVTVSSAVPRDDLTLYAHWERCDYDFKWLGGGKLDICAVLWRIL